MTLREVLDELYGVGLEDFVPTRTRLGRAARDAGDADLSRQISGLRKPTVAAWAINRLVRERPVEVERLLDLGTRMRTAQARLDAEEMRGLRGERENVLDGFTRAARFVADAGGQGLSVAAASAVRVSAVAALADQAAADAVAGGALVRTLDYAGFGEVDLDDAVAAPDARPSAPLGSSDEKAESTPGAERLAAHRRRLARLQEDLEAADQELARLSLVAAERERQSEKAAARLAELEGLLRSAREAARTTTEAALSAVAERDAAEQAHEQARRRLEEAREATPEADDV